MVPVVMFLDVVMLRISVGTAAFVRFLAWILLAAKSLGRDQTRHRMCFAGEEFIRAACEQSRTSSQLLSCCSCNVRSPGVIIFPCRHYVGTSSACSCHACVSRVRIQDSRNISSPWFLVHGENLLALHMIQAQVEDLGPIICGCR